VTARALWTRIVVGTGAAVATALLVPVPSPAPERTGALTGIAVGVLAGTVLFAALAQARPVLPTRAGLTAAQLVFLIGWSWVEEALWRRLLLGALAATVGLAIGFAAATVLFALAHREGRGAQIATGATFGVAYVATGRLVAAFASHAVYNLLVAGSRARPA
jgi:membrane protease YdiL (CAAX protease family)